MAQNLESYAKVHVLINGTLLLEYTDVTVSESAGLSDVLTVEKGFSGTAVGSAMTTISVSSVIPADYMEIQINDLYKGQIVDFQATAGGKSLICKCVVMDRNISYSNNSAPKMTLSLKTGPVNWQ
jgi:hypothetical protein